MFVAALIGALSLAGAAFGQTTTAPGLTAQDAETWLDGLIPHALARSDIAGAVVVVVKDGEVLLQKGYGQADVAAGKPVDPARTLFRPGSISKLFTWTAVMQLAEAGKLDLDRDVNAYLDFKIPPAFGKPITLRHILTHTPGFEEANRQLFAASPETMVPLEGYLKIWTPKRIFPPGEVPAYSNYGAALAGYIVQRVSGEPFDQYVARHIFSPLGMTRSTFVQPAPRAWLADLSQGYDLGSKPPEPPEIVTGTAAGSMFTTGADIARFMIAHLNEGRLGAAQILRPETTRLMHAPAFTPIPELQAMALGFYHEDVNGRRVVGHGGNTGEFHSDLHLFLDEGVGLFVSMNSTGTEGGRGMVMLKHALLYGFADRYFPAPIPREPTLATALAHGRQVAGAYVSTRRSESNFLRTASFLNQAKVAVGEDGVLTVSTFRDWAGTPKRWREVRPFVWREVGGKALLAARMKDGAVVGLSNSEVAPIYWLEPAPVSLGGWNSPLLKVATAVLAIAVLTWPVNALVRRRYGHGFALTGRAALAYRLTRVSALLVLAALAGWARLWDAAGSARASFFDSPLTPWLLGLKLLTALAAISVLAPIWNLTVVWRDGERSWWAKLSSALIVAAGLAMIWFAVNLRLIGFGTSY